MPAPRNVRGFMRSGNVSIKPRKNFCVIFVCRQWEGSDFLRRDMDEELTPAELDWLQRLHTDEPVKPAPPAAIANRLLTLGLAIELAEGGMQLTDLGRDRLRSPTDNSSSR